MMKKEIYRALSALLLAAMLSACSNEEIFAPEMPQPGSGAIELTVSAGDFVTDGAPDTRVADNGNATTFENGDRIGLIVLKNNGTDLVADNVPYTYDGTNWVFETYNSDGKTAAYYDNGISNVTYIAYFPYSKEADGVTTLDALKSKFTPKNDQRSEADYRASDLLVWTSGVVSVPRKKLDIALTHAYASISLSPEVKCTLADGSTFFYISSGVSDVSFTIGSDVCLPFQAEDGSFRCILPAGTSGTVRWFYTFEGETYGSSRDLGSGATANTRYARQETIDIGGYGLDKAQVGDFYCRNSSGNGYLIPGDAVTLPADANPVGIVYWVGNPTNTTDGDPLLGTAGHHPDCTHGLVAALHDAGGNSLWSSNYEDITNEWLSKQSGNPYGISSLKEQNKMQGYANTKALKGYNKAKGDGSKLRVLPIDLIGTYATTHPVPANSSDWYWPSVMELKYMCWGQNNSSGVAGKNMLDAQLGKVPGAASLQSSYYRPSTEYDDSWAWYVRFYDGNVYNDGLKDFSWYGVRAVLAF